MHYYFFILLCTLEQWFQWLKTQWRKAERVLGEIVKWLGYLELTKVLLAVIEWLFWWLWGFKKRMTVQWARKRPEVGAERHYHRSPTHLGSMVNADIYGIFLINFSTFIAQKTWVRAQEFSQFEMPYYRDQAMAFMFIDVSPRCPLKLAYLSCTNGAVTVCTSCLWVALKKGKISSEGKASRYNWKQSNQPLPARWPKMYLQMLLEKSIARGCGGPVFQATPRLESGRAAPPASCSCS